MAKKETTKKTKKLDQATARKLHEEGMSDAEIAEKFKVSEEEAKRTRKRA